MHRPRRSTALVLALALSATALAAPASAIYLGGESTARSDGGGAAGSWLDQLWESLVALFAADNGSVVPRP